MAARKTIIVALLLAVAIPAIPHSGGTNADGCHTNRKTGDYHCHGQKASVPGRDTYCHVINGERRCGYARGTCNELVARFGGHCQRE